MASAMIVALVVALLIGAMPNPISSPTIPTPKASTVDSGLASGPPPTAAPVPSPTPGPGQEVEATPVPVAVVEPEVSSGVAAPRQESQFMPTAEFIEGKVLFEDDFSSGFARNWRNLSNDIAIVQDESGNYVLQSSGPEDKYPWAEAGEATWQDYALEFRAKVVEISNTGGSWNLFAGIRQDNRRPACNKYAIWFRVESDTAGISLNGPSERGCTHPTLARVHSFSLTPGQWYSIRIEAVGPVITVYVDGELILRVEATNDPFLSGYVQLLGGPGVTVHYDDVRVMELVPAQDPAAKAAAESTPTPTPDPAPTPTPSSAAESGGQSVVKGDQPASAPEAPRYVEGRVLFEDDFDSGFARNWGAMGQPFSVIQDEAGGYVLQGSGYDLGDLAWVGDVTWRDYAFEFKVKILQGSDELSKPEVVATVRDDFAQRSCNRYDVSFEAVGVRGARMARLNMGSECQYTAMDHVNTLSLETDRWYFVRIEAAGPTIAAYLDGQRMLLVEDQEPILSGAVGLWNIAGTTVQYDDVRVVELIPGNPHQFLEIAAQSALDNPNGEFAVNAIQTALGRTPDIDEVFSDSSSGFGERQNNGDYPQYVDGRYLMATHPDDRCCNGSRILGNYTDLVVQLDMRLDSFEGNPPNWGSLALRRTRGLGFYIFDLKIESQRTVYLVGVNDKGPYSVLRQGNLPAGSSSTVGAWHNLIVVLQGNQIAYFIDGVLVEAFTDDTLTQGGFNMYAGWETLVSVNNFRLWDTR